MVAIFSLSPSFVDSNGYVSTKYGFIALAVVAQLVSVCVYLTYLFNFDKSRFCSRLSFVVSFSVTDIYLVLRFSN